jgi:CRP-like cAMP-binding protein
MQIRAYSKGETILNEGSEGEEIYFIQKGKVRVIKTINGEEFELAVLNEGTFFGEMSMFLGHKRTATVQAVEETEILLGDKDAFINMIRSDPDKAIEVISTLANRLHEAHRIISDIEGQLKAFTLILQPFRGTEPKPDKRPLPQMRPLGNFVDPRKKS